MGTAFVAIANDPSAAWHNPAGLYQMRGLNVSLETGNAPKYQQHPDSTYSVYEYNGNPIDLDPVEGNPNVPELNRFHLYDAWSNSTDDNNSSFLSINKGDGKTYGFGLYYYQPYHIQYNVDNNKGLGNSSIKDINIRGLIREKVSISGFGYSGDIFNSETRQWLTSAHYGLTLEYVKNNISDSRLTISDFDSAIELNGQDLSASHGWSGSLGFLTTLYRGKLREPFSPIIKLGGVYRFSTVQADQTVMFEQTTLGADNWFNVKPPNWDLGLSSNMQLTSGPSFGLLSIALSGQYGQTEFDSIFTDITYKKTAFGTALRLTRLQGSFVQQVELRLGVFVEKAASEVNNVLLGAPVYQDQQRDIFRFVRNIDLGLAYPDIKGFTWGLQVAFEDGLLFEFASEHRVLQKVFHCDGEFIAVGECAPKESSRHYWTAALRYNW